MTALADTVEVTHPYTAQADDEHSLKLGEIITNVTQVADGWCEGLLNGRRALFPDNFVKSAPSIIKPPQAISSSVTSSVGISATGEKSFAAPRGKQNGSAVSAGGGVGVSELRSKLGGIIGGPPPPGAAARGLRKTGNKKVRVTHQYASQHEDELSLDVGAVIDVLRTEGEEGWWEGSLNGKVGMFPSNFVEVIDAADAQTADSPTEIKGRKVEGVGFGNIFAGAPIHLRPTKPEKREGDVSKTDAGPSRMSIKGKPPPVIPGASSNAAATKPEPIRAKVLFPYTAENDDELTLGEGQVIIVLDQDLEDKGWWKGDLNGKIGVFPDNFVELLPPETPVAAPIKNPVPPPGPIINPSKPVPVKAEEPAKPAAAKPLWGDKKIAKIPPDIKTEPEDIKPKRPLESLPSSSIDKISAVPAASVPAASVPVAKPAPGRPPGRPAVGPSDDSKKGSDVAAAPGGPGVPKPVPSGSAGVFGAKFGGAGGVISGGVSGVGGSVSDGISHEQYAELQKEIVHLKDTLDQTRKAQERQFLKLMGEIDEEKKTRLSLQVEIDRLKKFLVNE